MSNGMMSRRTALSGAVALPIAAAVAPATILESPAATVSKPDPIFAAIDLAREAEKAIEEEGADALEQLNTARTQLAYTVPTTPPGLASLTTFLRFAQDNLCGAAPYFEDAEDATAFAVSLDTGVRGMVGLKAWTSAELTSECSYPDLAREFDAFYARWQVETKNERDHMAAFEAELFRRTGITREDAPRYGDPDPTGYNETLHALSSEGVDDDPVDEDGASIVWNELNEERDELVKRIFSRPVLSLADLVLQARAAAVWHYPEDSFTTRKDTPRKQLMKNICKFAGVDLLPGLDRQVQS